LLPGAVLRLLLRRGLLRCGLSCCLLHDALRRFLLGQIGGMIARTLRGLQRHHLRGLLGATPGGLCLFFPGSPLGGLLRGGQLRRKSGRAGNLRGSQFGLAMPGFAG
jgi:hypothetical protein